MKHYIKKIKGIWTNNYFNKIRMEKSKLELRKIYNNVPNITILSPNCIGGEIYNLLGLEFCSPLINTSLDRNDFVRFVENLDGYLSISPKIFTKKDNTCYMVLEDKQYSKIKIQFPHDFNADEVRKKWERRIKRINYDKIYIICDDRGIDSKELNKLNALKFNKMIIFSSKELHIKNNFVIKKYKNKNQVGKYNVKGFNGLYKFQSFFNCAEFLSEN